MTKFKLFCWLCFVCFSQHTLAIKVSPPNWWAGMKHETLQIMIARDNIAGAQVKVDHPGVSVTAVNSLDSANYLFIDLAISDAKPGSFPIRFFKHGKIIDKVNYKLKKRDDGSATRRGFDSTDSIYLITPDRFANGDSQNDTVEGYEDKLNRNFKGGRHGGDIQGMINHLDYIADMGFTQIWTMPMLENAMEHYSYHGYSTTDFYKIDPRYGSEELYRQLSDKAADYGIGVIIDVVLNHIGSEHPWMTDKPSEDWINHKAFSPTSHRREVLHDPHAAYEDKAAFSDGWFVPTMPDLNQRNPYLAQYLIQNAIWWVEYANLSGIRVDTYSYSDKDFLSQWTARLMKEYPNLNIVGEEWSVNPLITSYWQKGTHRHDGYESALPSVMDFPLQSKLVSALRSDETWATGLRELYEVLASDFVYGNAGNLVVFADNHDMSRIYTQIGEDKALWNIALTFILTTRGIPQVFYGTEILMGNSGTDDHGIIRSDFPGGWQGDTINAFTKIGLSKDQMWAQNRIRQLLSLRKMHPGLMSGNLTHYGPQEGMYVYFRHTETQYDKALMVVINKNEKSEELSLSRFNSMLKGFSRATRLGNEKAIALDNNMTVPAKSASVWLLQ
ncbi:glycoside hydrolase family 13 protein [Alteromonas sp. ASW11-130]|uniref:glycoside hydrolase family 13 protein n=1 Tax=Alteromonas sp. ASW11-130 TaxID=3015775 RepID=UPI002241A120|nr:glycoside hydrolase family 13 protein [Alteromonas sp. ASW11-130]MCW8092194.1 glycoside hydrolase family 13 protein [Alteromonas sp. ASW11-130]